VGATETGAAATFAARLLAVSLAVSDFFQR
jgi:hypothetical protein